MRRPLTTGVHLLPLHDLPQAFRNFQRHVAVASQGLPDVPQREVGKVNRTAAAGSNAAEIGALKATFGKVRRKLREAGGAAEQPVARKA